MIAVATGDLFFRAKIEEITRQRNAEIMFVERPDNVIDEISTNNCNMLIVDLNFDEFEPLKSIEHIKKLKPQVHVIGYLSHVQVELREAAVRAGCDEVMPRSQFSRDLEQILTQK